MANYVEKIQIGTGDSWPISATKMANSRTFKVNLASTSAVSFNGTTNVTPGVTGTLPIANGGTGATTAANAVKMLNPNAFPTPSYVFSMGSSGYSGGGGYTTIEQLKPILNVGNMYIDYLWTNASPTSSFGGGTVVSLNLSNYSFVMVLTRVGTSYVEMLSSICPVGYNGRIVGCWGHNNNDFHRDFSVSTTGITFSGAYEGGQYDTSYCIPYAIYGIQWR